MSKPQKRRGRPRKDAQKSQTDEPEAKKKCPATRSANKLKKNQLDAENNNIPEDVQNDCNSNKSTNRNVVDIIKMDWDSDDEVNYETTELQFVAKKVDNNDGDIEFIITPFEVEVQTTHENSHASNLTNKAQGAKKKYKPKPKCKKKPEELEAEKRKLAELAKENKALKAKNTISPKSNKFQTPGNVVTITPAEAVGKVVRKIPKSEIQQSNSTNINKTESMKMEELLVNKFKKEQEKQGANNRFDDLLKEDVFTHEDVKNYDVFVKTTKSVYETYEKVKDENGETIHKCLLCEYATETFKKMACHYKFKHRETPIEEMFFCNYKGCHYRAVHKGLYMWHLRRHSLAAEKLVPALFLCHECKVKFPSRKEYLIHLKHEHKAPGEAAKKDADFPCATCNYRASKLVYLKSHIYSCHVPAKLKTNYDCNVCGYKTYRKAYLEKHMMSHLKDKKKKKQKNSVKVTKRNIKAK